MPTASTVYFADIVVPRLEGHLALPAKFQRMLDKFDLPGRVKGKNVGIKMHFGTGFGISTIHPVFIRILVQALKNAGSKSIKAMDSNPDEGLARGYTQEVLGCEVVSTFGPKRNYLHRQDIGFKELDFVDFGGEAIDCDFFIDLSHVKAHGACGFGGALKNIAMGVVPGESRGKIHRLEGGLSYDHDKCTYCKKCFKECPNQAISLDDAGKQIQFFFHNCTYCQHCVLVCPAKAITLENRTFHDFAKGMAMVTDAFLRRHARENTLFINVLLDTTIFCDCWGISTASLIQDIGIVASNDIIAVETASLDLIAKEPLLEKGMPKGRKLREGKHLFEKIHGKDPYLMVNYLQELYGGSKEYSIEEIL